MQAIQPTVTPLQPVKNSPRVAVAPSRSSSRRHSYPHQALAAETGVKLAVNMVLSVCATSALIQLWPHYWAVQEKLQEIQRKDPEAQEEEVNLFIILYLVILFVFIRHIQEYLTKKRSEVNK